MTFDRKIDAVRKEGTGNRKRLIFFVLCHLHRFIAREIKDANRALKTRDPKVVEGLVRRREAQPGAPYLTSVVERVFGDCGFASAAGFDQLFGGPVPDLRTAVDVYLAARLTWLNALGREGDARAKSAERQTLKRLRKQLARRSRLLENAEVVWFAYLICITPGTQRCLLKLFEGLLVFDDIRSRRQLLEIVAASSRGMLIHLTGIESAVLESIDAGRAQNLIDLYANSTLSLARGFVRLMQRNGIDGATVVAIGYSSAVSACISRSRGSIRQVFVVDRLGPDNRAAEQMVSTLSAQGVSVSRIQMDDLATLPVRNPLVLFGFEAVTPTFEFVDPRRTISEAIWALRSADLQAASVFALGESWKIRDLAIEDGATHQRSVYRAVGVPKIITANGAETGREKVQAHLRQEMRRWSAAVRSSLAQSAAEDVEGGVIMQLDLRAIRALEARLERAVGEADVATSSVG